jgi:hypothetical protein
MRVSEPCSSRPQIVGSIVLALSGANEGDLDETRGRALVRHHEGSLAVVVVVVVLTSVNRIRGRSYVDILSVKSTHIKV